MKQPNNKVLIGILLALATVFALTKVFRSPGLSSNLDAEPLAVDTAKISELRILPSSDNRKEVKLIKEGQEWKVSHGKIRSTTDGNAVRKALGALIEIQPDRLVTRRSEKWNDYNVGDSTGTAVQVLNNSEVLAHFWVGEETNGLTYFRKAGENEVYEVEGYLQSIFNLKFNDWRDKSFLRVKKDSIDKIVFNYPDSGFVVSRGSKIWTIENEQADTTKVDRYLNKVATKNLNAFADDFTPPGEAQLTLTLESKAQPVEVVKAWKTSNQWVVNSSRRKEVYFSADSLTLMELFPGKVVFRP